MDTLGWHIYVLKDPQTDTVLYVGRTKNPVMRLHAHLSEATKDSRHNTRKNNALRRLIDQGSKPVLEVIETGTGDSAEAECRWIAAFRAQGIRLLNETDGGEGVPGLIRAPRTAEHTTNLTAALQKAMTPARRQRLSVALKGYIRTAEHNSKLATALTGKTIPPETRAKISASLKGNQNAKGKAKRPMSPELKTRVSEAMKAFWKNKKSTPGYCK